MSTCMGPSLNELSEGSAMSTQMATVFSQSQNSWPWLQVFNFTILSRLQNLWKLDAHEKYMF